ncbi:MAG: putative acyltransferase [Schlesneria sp.]|nr:putative acyltransferase [Schlesneria sp.]
MNTCQARVPTAVAPRLDVPVRMQGIDACRGIAALLVALFHVEIHLKKDKYLNFDPFNGWFLGGFAGVDFFFVLSGFIITYVHWNDFGNAHRLPRYIRNRVARVYPLLWCVTVPFIIASVLYKSEYVPKNIDKRCAAIITSLTLIPLDIDPLLTVLWTLRHEMFFYMLFSLVLWNARIASFALPIWVGSCVMNSISGSHTHYLIDFLLSLYNLEFVLGIGCAFVLRKYRLPFPEALTAAGVLLFVAFGLNDGTGDRGYTNGSLVGVFWTIRFGCAAALVVLGIGQLDLMGRGTWVPRWLALVGTASYSIYLIHLPVISIMSKVLIKWSSASSSASVVLASLIFVIAIVVGVLTYLCVERPLARFFRTPSRIGSSPSNANAKSMQCEPEAAPCAPTQATDVPVVPVASKRFALLDCWRGIACLMVVIAHAREPAELRYLEGNEPVSDFAGQLVVFLGTFRVGVQIFFVISGYCISATVEGFGRRNSSVLRYFSRRFWRIYPPYWSLFILMWIAVTLLEFAASRGWVPQGLNNSKSPLTLTASQFLGNVTLTETWRYHLFGSESKLFLKHAWTLCYEEQFYLFVGLSLIAFPRKYFRSIVWLSVISIACLLLSALNVVDIRGFSIDRYWFSFAIGVLVYYRLCHASIRDRCFIDVSVASAAIAALAIDLAPIHLDEADHAFVHNLAVSMIFGVSLIVMHRWDAYLSTLRPFKALAFVGVISYSLYLIHAPVVPIIARFMMKLGLKSDLATLCLTVPLCMLASVPMAWLFWFCCERPFLYRKSSVGVTS